MWCHSTETKKKKYTIPKVRSFDDSTNDSRAEQSGQPSFREMQVQLTSKGQALDVHIVW